MKFLADRFGWQPYEHKHYESRFTRFYEGYWLPTRFGYDKRRAHFSSLILTKQMTREEALDRLSRPAYDETTIEQIVKQCARLARVKDVRAVTTMPHIEREMALIDVSVTRGDERQEVMSLVNIFRAKVVDISHDKMILEMSGTQDKVDTFIDMLKPLEVNEVTRSGAVAITLAQAASEGGAEARG